MSTDKAIPKVNDRVIYVPTSNAEPQVTVITRLTPTGQIGIAEHSKAFRRNGYGEKCYVSGSTWSDKARVYLYSDEALQRLKDAAEAKRQAEADKAAERERQAAERDQRNAAQIAEVKRVCGDVLPILSHEVLPNDARLYQLNVPLNPEKNEGRNNRGFDRLLVHCIDSTNFNYRTSVEEPCVEVSRAVITAMRGISSLSSWKGDNDETVLWEMVKDRYFDWS